MNLMALMVNCFLVVVHFCECGTHFFSFRIVFLASWWFCRCCCCRRFPKVVRPFFQPSLKIERASFYLEAGLLWECRAKKKNAEFCLEISSKSYVTFVWASFQSQGQNSTQIQRGERGDDLFFRMFMLCICASKKWPWLNATAATTTASIRQRRQRGL